ncbi:MAG TPA: glycine oxidase ThiO [Ktedonobacteraceae bacterium]|nr:glycine oxidase ThiO [Ktedonobacteraceae bacterium]
MSRTTDVLIIGGGVIGCSIAYFLRRAGVEVAIVEREEVAAEASSAAAGLLAPLGALTGPGAFTDLVLASWSLARELLPALDEESGVATEYVRYGSLRVTTDAGEAAALRQQMTFWQALGIEAAWLTGEEARQREPRLADDVKAAIYAPLEGSFRPAGVTRAYAGAARRMGARFYDHTEVVGIQRNGSRVIGVQTAQGEVISCNHLVIAAGAWSAQCGEWLGFSIPVSPMRGQILSLRQPEPALKHILFGNDVYFVPKIDDTIFVGATVEQADFDKRITAGGIAWILSSTLRLTPTLESAPIVKIWAGLRPWSPDSRPILGKAPGWQNVTLATGHSAMGFELSAITGKTIAELITTGQTPEIIRAFGIERFLEREWL